MSKNILVVRCEKNVKFEEWNAICNFIQDQVKDDYKVIGLIKGIDVECITEDDKVFYIDGDIYSYKNMKEFIENNTKFIKEKNEDVKETSQEENIEKEKVE